MISGNRWITLAEALENAREVYDYLAGSTVTGRWTSYAVCAMLGNMWTESHVNPGIWQNLDAGNTDLGFGLVQWTPATKLFSWLDENGYAHDSGTGQLERIKWEVANKKQWAATSKYPYSFYEFTQWQTGESVEAMIKMLADMFLRNYERPKNLNQPNRGEMGWYFWQKLYNGEDIDPKPDPPPEPPEPPDPDPPIVPEAPEYLFNVQEMFLPSNGDRLISPIFFNKTQIHYNGIFLYVNDSMYMKLSENVYKLVHGGAKL
jgi:hypothetical protein